MDIPFTHYVRPDGRRQYETVTVADVNPEHVELLLAAGYRFGAELLTDDKTVSLTVESPNEDEGDIATVLTTNGPEVLDAVRRLVVKGYEAVFPLVLDTEARD